MLDDSRKRFLLYDYLQVAGGAERLSLELASGVPGLELVVSRVYPATRVFSGADMAVELGTPVTRRLGRIPEAMVNFRFRSGFLRAADSVIYSGFYAPLAVHSQRGGASMYYCHTPPRFAYDLIESTMQGTAAPLRPGLAMALAGFRRLYESALARMDCVIANSENVRNRLQRYLGIDSDIIHPPIDVERFRWLGQKDYFVSLARLVPYKRVDRIVRAFMAMPDQNLVVASGGPELNRLKALAQDAPNIRFTGWQAEDDLTTIVGHARAAIYVPTDEDFGMSPVEAMAAGKPVIGVAEGGLKETVIDEATGYLIAKDPTPGDIAQAVRRLDVASAAAMRTACEAQARKFCRENFISSISRRLAALESSRKAAGA